MTGALSSWSNASDAHLAVTAARGDRQALAGIYDRYADRLYDFCMGMVGDREAAADCVQDVFCVAATNLTTLREPDKLRPWLYSIARHQAMRRLRDRYREQVSDDLPETASPEAGPDTMAGRSDLANLVSAAAGGLSDRDRMLLELTYRHGLDGPELADALGVTLTNANTMVFRLRKTIERSLGALLVARSVHSNRRACPELTATLQGWDGHFTILIRKRVARHIESCQTCDQEQRRRVNPAALLGGAPLFIPAPKWLRDQTLRRVQLTSASTGINPAVGPSPHQHQDAYAAASTAPHAAIDVTRHHPNRRVVPLIALMIGIPLSVLGLTLAWLRPFDAPVRSAAVGESELRTTETLPTAGTAPARPTPVTPLPTTVTTPRTTGAVPIPTTTNPPPPTTTAPWSTTFTTTPATTTDRTTPYTTTTPVTTTDRTTHDTTTPYTTAPVTTTPYTTTPDTTTPYTTAPVTTTPPPRPRPEPLPTPVTTPAPISVVPDGPIVH